MRIIHILLGKANPESANGVNKVVHYLATAQHLLGNEVEVWGITSSGKPPLHEHIYAMRIFKRSKWRFILTKELIRAILSLDRDVWVQLHSVFIPEFYIIIRLLLRRKICYGITPHGGYLEPALARNKLLKKIYFLFFESFILKNAQLLHAIGKSELLQLPKLAGHERIVLAPNGQDLNVIKFVKHQIPSDEKPIFGYCGRLDIYHKGLDLMVEGFAKYKREGGKGELWIIGDGVDRNKLEAMVHSLGLNRCVKFWGSKFSDEKYNIIYNFDIFLHTSRFDGIPTACLEAAALSKPLLVSKGTNLDSFVRKYSAGWVLELNTSQEISNKMWIAKREYSNGNLKKYGTQAKKMIEAEFDWKYIAKKLMQAYKDFKSQKRECNNDL